MDDVEVTISGLGGLFPVTTAPACTSGKTSVMTSLGDIQMTLLILQLFSEWEGEHLLRDQQKACDWCLYKACN
jgi:hypothetical protein